MLPFSCPPINFLHPGSPQYLGTQYFRPSPGISPCPCHPDIDECTEGTSGCPANCECINVNGTAACHCKDGFAADGAAFRDSRAPTITIDDNGRPWQRLAAPGAAGAKVDFPIIHVSDTVDRSSVCSFQPGRCECRALVGGGSSLQPVYPSSHPGGGTEFPVGTTIVACKATDSAGNQGPAATFAIEVQCPGTHPLKQRGPTALCTGEAWGWSWVAWTTPRRHIFKLLLELHPDVSPHLILSRSNTLLCQTAPHLRSTCLSAS
jgi:hypothetical protein